MTDPINIQDLKSFDLGVVKIKATITQVSSHRIRNGNLMTEAVIADETGSTKCVWFSKHLMQGVHTGHEYILAGKYQLKYGRAALQQPVFVPTGRKHSTANLKNAPFDLPKTPAKYTRKPSRDWSGLWTLLFWAAIIGGLWLWHAAHPTVQRETSPSYNSSSSSAPSSTSSDSATSSYWYCWDTGAPDPHHLGYHVNNDHHCTYDELRSAGFSEH